MAKPTFEDAMKRLEDIVQELEAGTLSLDEA
ncbi:MAG: exodeoxyribonuclease VII small subunit, partial [Thermodesulfobacteriota bacterium]|nr:exodeoxyribonuclease VII small subunit [Thermodesulfobacteriota bacterium]